jgi:hypothetical protein
MRSGIEREGVLLERESYAVVNMKSGCCSIGCAKKVMQTRYERLVKEYELCRVLSTSMSLNSRIVVLVNLRLTKPKRSRIRMIRELSEISGSLYLPNRSSLMASPVDSEDDVSLTRCAIGESA